MRGKVFKAFTGVALSVALVVSLFPVPSGSPLLDRRYEKAEANPAVAALVVFGTAAAAYGVYAAGVTSATYEANLQQMYNDCLDTSGMTTDAFSGMLTGAVNSAGNVNLGALTSSFFPVLARCVEGWMGAGDVVTGENSKASGSSVIYFGTRPFPALDSVPFQDEALEQLKILNSSNTALQAATADMLCAYSVYTGSSSGRSYTGHSYRYPEYADEKYFSIGGESNSIYGPTYQNNRGNHYEVIKQIWSDGQVTWSCNKRTFFAAVYSNTYFLLNSFDYQNADGYTVTKSWMDTAIATVTSGVAANTAAFPETVVEPFEPDAGTLENGWDSTAVVDAISANTGTVEGIGNQLEGVDGTLNEILDTIFPWTSSLEAILSAVNPLAAILTGVQSLVNSVLTISGVVTGVQSSPFSWLQTWWNSLTGWWASLLAWIGATPIGTLIGNVVTGIGNVTSGVGDVVGALDDVVGAIGGLVGVNDASTWWGTLSGWWEGLLDWLGSTPIGELVGSVVRGISGVIDGISTGVGTLSATLTSILAALDGIVAGEYGFPTFTLEAGTGQLAVDFSKRNEFEAALEERAPFAYVNAVLGTFGRISGTYSNAESFYVDIQVPYSEEVVRFDGGDVLLRQYNGFTLAYLLRIGLTAVLCMGLLMFAYNVVTKIGVRK